MRWIRAVALLVCFATAAARGPAPSSPSLPPPLGSLSTTLSAAELAAAPRWADAFFAGRAYDAVRVPADCSFAALRPTAAAAPRWAACDAVVNWTRAHGLSVHAGPLLPNDLSSAPRWLTRLPAEALTTLVWQHSAAVAARYGRNVSAWDVVDKPLGGVADGPLWLLAIGAAALLGAGCALAWARRVERLAAAITAETAPAAAHPPTEAVGAANGSKDPAALETGAAALDAPSTPAVPRSAAADRWSAPEPATEPASIASADPAAAAGSAAAAAAPMGSAAAAAFAFIATARRTCAHAGQGASEDGGSGAGGPGRIPGSGTWTFGASGRSVAKATRDAATSTDDDGENSGLAYANGRGRHRAGASGRRPLLMTTPRSDGRFFRDDCSDAQTPLRPTPRSKPAQPRPAQPRPRPGQAARALAAALARAAAVALLLLAAWLLLGPLGANLFGLRDGHRSDRYGRYAEPFLRRGALHPAVHGYVPIAFAAARAALDRADAAAASARGDGKGGDDGADAGNCGGGGLCGDGGKVRLWLTEAGAETDEGWSWAGGISGALRGAKGRALVEAVRTWREADGLKIDGVGLSLSVPLGGVSDARALRRWSEGLARQLRALGELGVATRISAIEVPCAPRLSLPVLSGLSGLAGPSEFRAGPSGGSDAQPAHRAGGPLARLFGCAPPTAAEARQQARVFAAAARACAAEPSCVGVCQWGADDGHSPLGPRARATPRDACGQPKPAAAALACALQRPQCAELSAEAAASGYDYRRGPAREAASGGGKNGSDGRAGGCGIQV